MITKLTVLGCGYVGLVTATCFAEMGYHVTCLDVAHEKIALLKEGISPIYEPSLEEMIKRNSEAKRLSFTTDYALAVQNAEIILVAVPTPSSDDGTCNLSFLQAAMQEIARSMDGYKIIVLKSTVPAGTARAMKKELKDLQATFGKTGDFDIVSNPEFLKEGSAIQDFMRPDRVLIGCDSEKPMAAMRELYRPFMFSHERLLFMDTVSAELSKYAANTMLATRISFMNWLSLLCEKTGADILEIRRALGSDKRIGYDFLWAGIGFGGSCLPKDLTALKAQCNALAVPSHLLEVLLEINQQQKALFAEKIISYFEQRGGSKKKTVAILGLSFKPGTDDMREAPSLVIIDKLLQAGYHLRLFDPIAMPYAKKILQKEGIEFCSDEYEAAKQADAIALVTEWKQFRHLDLKLLLQTMKGKAFFDGRNQYHPQEMAKNGFDYISIGRTEVGGAAP